MAISLSKMAPSAIVIAAVGYCCLPYLDQPGTRAAPSQEVSKSHEIPLELLSPKVGSSQPRDPFNLQAKVDKNAKGVPTATNRAVSKSAGKVGNAKAPESAVAAAVREAALRAAATEKAAQELRDALKGLVLNGTYLSSKRRLAVINSKLYSEGQTVLPASPSAKSFIVSRIDQHKVQLQLGVQTVELGYPTMPVKSDKKPPAPASRQAVTPILQTL